MAEKDMIDVAGLEIELERRGNGPPLLLLQGEEARESKLPMIDELARDFEVLIPSPPGFGGSPASERISTIDDIAYLYLDLLEQRDLKDVAVLGFSLGGWIAAEVATKTCDRIGKLVLVGPYGIKIGGIFDRDIADIYMLSPDEVVRRMFSDPEKAKIDYTAMSDDELEIVVRNRAATAAYCWEPYMHNPRLAQRLHRISVPTLLIWGANDGIVTPDYGRAYAERIPGARFESVSAAAHLPQLEQPDAFMNIVRSFLV